MLWHGKAQEHTDLLFEKSKHTVCTISEQLIQAIASPFLDISIANYTFSNDGGYVAVHHTSVVAVSYQ